MINIQVVWAIPRAADAPERWWLSFDQINESGRWYFQEFYPSTGDTYLDTNYSNKELIIDAETGIVSSEYDFSYKLTQNYFNEGTAISFTLRAEVCFFCFVFYIRGCFLGLYGYYSSHNMKY